MQAVSTWVVSPTMVVMVVVVVVVGGRSKWSASIKRLQPSLLRSSVRAKLLEKTFSLLLRIGGSSNCCRDAKQLPSVVLLHGIPSQREKYHSSSSKYEIPEFTFSHSHYFLRLWFLQRIIHCTSPSLTLFAIHRIGSNNHALTELLIPNHSTNFEYFQLNLFHKCETAIQLMN